MTGKGRLYRIANPNQTLSKAPSVQELFRKGFDKINANGLRNLLSHPDMRVRQAAQFQLVAKADTKSLGGIARQGKGLARLHAVWGLGQLARGGKTKTAHWCRCSAMRTVKCKRRRPRCSAKRGPRPLCPA